MNNNLSKDGKFFLLFAIVQIQDLDSVQDALIEHKLVITRLSSVGGFLGKRNTTFLIVLEESRIPMTMEVIKENCKQRIEYIAVPLESAPLPLPTPTPITIGGATIFSLEVEYFEVI